MWAATVCIATVALWTGIAAYPDSQKLLLSPQSITTCNRAPSAVEKSSIRGVGDGGGVGPAWAHCAAGQPLGLKEGTDGLVAPSSRELQSGGGDVEEGEDEYPYTTTLLRDDLTLRWRLNKKVNPTAVSFLLEGRGKYWIAMARSDVYYMLNSRVTGASGSGPAVVGRLAEGVVRQYILGGYNMEAIKPVDTPTITAASVGYNDTTGLTTLRFTRPLAAMGDPSEKSIDPGTPTRFIFSHGISEVFGFHGSNYGSVVLTLRPAQCTRAGVCHGRGSCPSQMATTCVCDVGYAGSTCGACALGFANNGTSVCYPLTNGIALEVLATTTLEFVLSYDDVAGAPGSVQRAAFMVGVTEDIAKAVNISTSRVNITAVTNGSILVDVTLLPPAAAIGAPDWAIRSHMAVPMVALSLATQALLPGSLLMTGAYTRALRLPPTGQLSFKFNVATPKIFTATLSNTLSMAWWMAGGVAFFQVTSHAGPHTWFGVGFNTLPTMVGSDVVAYVPGGGNTPTSQVMQFTVTQRAAMGVQPVPPSAATLDHVEVDATAEEGSVLVTWSRPMKHGPYTGAVGIPTGGAIYLVYATGEAGASTISRHLPHDAGVGYFDIMGGGYKPVNLLPSPTRLGHGLLMALSWGVLMPVGILLARFTKGVAPTGGPYAFWFTAHKVAQVTAVVGAWVGFVLAVAMVPDESHFTRLHHRMGLAVMVLGTWQPVNAAFRPHKPERGKPSTLGRRGWEWVHKGTGYATACLSAVTVWLGLMAAHAHFTFFAAYIAFIATLVALFASVTAQRALAAHGRACCRCACTRPPLAKTVAVSGEDFHSERDGEEVPPPPPPPNQQAPYMGSPVDKRRANSKWMRPSLRSNRADSEEDGPTSPRAMPLPTKIPMTTGGGMARANSGSTSTSTTSTRAVTGRTTPAKREGVAAAGLGACTTGARGGRRAVDVTISGAASGDLSMVAVLPLTVSSAGTGGVPPTVVV